MVRGFESNRGAEISSKFPTLAIRWTQMPCVEKGRVGGDVAWRKNHAFDSGQLSLRCLPEPRWRCLADHIIYRSGAQEEVRAGDRNV